MASNHFVLTSLLFLTTVRIGKYQKKPTLFKEYRVGEKERDYKSHKVHQATKYIKPQSTSCQHIS